ncbi:MAG TPA: transglycosylase domain-containing protein, partial [Actinomycetota bacterium]
MSSRLPPQDPTQPQEPVNFRDPGSPVQPGRPRRRADRPTAPAAARVSLSATARALKLVFTQPSRGRAQRRARIDLGRAVAASLAGQPAPPLLATPLAAHRAAQLRLASTDPPPRPGSGTPEVAPGPRPGDGVWSARQAGAGSAAEPQAPRVRGRVASRAGRSAGPDGTQVDGGAADQGGAGSRAGAGRAGLRERDLAAELERLLLIVVQFLPRLAARIRLRVADERLGAWATGLSDPQDPAVATARERAAEAQRAAISARAATAANWRQAGDAAQLSARLVSQAVADFIGWVAHGVRSGSSMLVAWLVSVAVAARRRLRHGSAAAGRHARAGSAVTRESLRASSAATREGLRASTVAASRGVRTAGRGVRGAGAGIAGAAGGLASRIDALADRRSGRHSRPGPGSGPGVPAGAPAKGDRPGSGMAASTNALAGAIHADVEADTQIGAPIDLDRDGPADVGADTQLDGLAGPGAATREGRTGRAGNGDGPPAEVPGVAATQELDGARNGHHDGAGRSRLVLDPADPVEAWWLPSSITGAVPEPPPPGTGRRARRSRDRAGRDPVVAGLASGLHRLTRPFRAIGGWLAPVVTAMAAPPNHRRRGWKAFARPVVVALALTLVVATATAVPAGMLVADSVKGAGADLPELAELRQLRQPERTQVYDRQGRVIEVLKDEQDRIVVPLSQISPLLQQAVIAAEDARFYEHKGVDDRGIIRAAVTNLLSGQVSQGGSTITQQLVRNSYPDLKDISIIRKIKEAALAAQLEGKLTKQEILHRYLNRVYFGAGYYGVEAASKGYFGKHASEVTLAQAATLAGIIREPVSSEPRAHPDRAKLLRDSVLQRMTQLGMVPAERAAKAQKLPVRIQPPRHVGGRYPWFIDGLRRQLQEDERLGKTRESRTQRLFEGGLRIHTTLDRDMQRAAEQAVDRYRPPSGPDIALVAIDPRDGGVRAVVGGRNWETSSYNAALQGAGRQPGSSFKPFVLAAALDAGISPDSVWESSGFRDQIVCGTRWPEVDNYEGGGSGPVSVRDATRRSVNGVYARLMEKLCPEKVATMAER